MEKVIDAGGTGTDLESVWIIRTGEDDVSAIYNGETGMMFGDIYEQLLYQYDAGGAVLGSFAGLVTTLTTWLGLQIGSAHSVLRVANIDYNNHETVEDFIQDGLAEFPSDRMATHIFGSRRIRRAIQKGRQKTSDGIDRVSMVNSIDGTPVLTSEGLLPETALT